MSASLFYYNLVTFFFSTRSFPAPAPTIHNLPPLKNPKLILMNSNRIEMDNGKKGYQLFSSMLKVFLLQ